MFEAEARRVREILLSRAEASPLLNLGSSTRAFREREKPHIQRELFGPLEAAGVEVVHCDLKAAPGVDIPGDILDPLVMAKLKAHGFRSLLCANLLEHVRDPKAVAAACEAIVGPGGLVLATVPESFPYHADPLDTGLRPAPEALAALFTRSTPLLAETVEGRTYKEEIAAKSSNLLKELGGTFLALLKLRPRSFRARLDRWRWYRRRFRVSIALVQVGEG